MSELYIHSNCHPSSPTWTKISGDNDILSVECAECHNSILAFDLSKIVKDTQKMVETDILRWLKGVGCEHTTGIEAGSYIPVE